MSEFKINTELSERQVDCREKNLSHVRIPGLEVIEANFQSTIDSVNKNILFSDSISDKEMTENILRAQIVFLESAFDYLCHCVIKFGFDRIYKGDWPTTEKYDHFSIPMEVIRRVMENGDGIYFEDYLNEKISPMTFLDPKVLKDNLNLVFPDMLDKVAKLVFPMEKQPLDTLKNKLKMMYDRRNRIAHQDDREHIDLTKHSITREEVEEFKDTIITVVEKMLYLMKQD